MTGSIEATATMTSATWPPSHIAATACRLLKLGSRKCARYGRVPPSETSVAAELALGRLDRRVGLARRHPEALGDQLEVVDQRLHRGAHDLADVVEAVAQAVAADGQLRRPGDLLVLDHDRLALGALQPVERLLDDLQRLVHLVDADAQPVVGVAAGAGDDLEVVGLVAAVRRRLAQVVRQAGRAQHRAGHAQRHAAGEVHERRRRRCGP